MIPIADSPPNKNFFEVNLTTADLRYIPWRRKKPVRVMFPAGSLAQLFRRILNNNDFVAVVYGPKGIGKSETIIQLCRLICPEFRLEDDIVFSLDEFYDTMDKTEGKHWPVKLLDDFGSEMDPREGMFDRSRNAVHHFQTSRTFGVGSFITTPNPKFINKDMRERLADFYIELKQKVRNRFVMGTIQYNQSNYRYEKTYGHSLRVSYGGNINNRNVGHKIWSYVFYPPPKEVHEAYVPLRELKGRMNFEKGAAGFRDAAGKKQTRNVMEIVDEIIAKQDEFVHYAKSSGRAVVDSGLVSANYPGLRVKELKQAISLVRQKAEKRE